ncbi:MAG: AAA family ATPase [Desulfurococcales archaeon]|nr:AAA family ATPase [Desulfurococcales archaeon]
MTYRISRIELRNFKSHVNTVITLPPGSIAILGQNGAGKSSILDAVRLALTGNPKVLGGLAGLVNDRLQGPGGRPRGSFRVSITLESRDGRPVQAEVSGGYGPSSYILKVGGRIEASGQSAYRRRLHSILGLAHLTDPASFIDRAVVIKQGGLHEIADKMDRGKELREEIEAAIGIPDLREAVDRISRLEVAVDTLHARGDARPTEWYLRDVGRRIVEARRAAERLEEEAERLRGEARRLEAERRRLEDLVASLQEKLEEAQRLREAQRSLERERKALEEELDRVRRELEDLAEELREAEEAARRIPGLEKLAGLAGLLDQLEEAWREEREIESYISRHAILREALAAIEEHRGEALEYVKIREELERLEAERRRLEREANHLLGTLDALTERIKRLEAERRRILEEASRLLGARIGEEDLKREIGGLRRRLEDLYREKEELYRRRGMLEREAGEKRRILELLQDSRTSRCPVCGRSLDEEHASELKARTLRELSKVEKEAGETARRIREVVEEIRRSESLLKRLEDLQARLEGLEDVDDAGLRAARERLEDLRRRISRIEEEAEALRRRKEELEHHHTRYKWGVDEVNRRGYTLDEAKAIASELEELEAKLRGIAGRRRELEERLLESTGAGSIAEARRMIREASAELERARVKASRLDRIRGRITMLRGVEEDARARLRRVEEELGKVRDRLNELAGIESMLEDARARLRRVEEELHKARAEAGVKEEEARRWRADLEKLEVLRRRVRAGIAARRILERLQEALYKRSVMVLENEMSRILDSFNLDPSQVELRDQGSGPVVRVITRSGRERSVSMLSGGERTSVALAYILALNKMMGTRIGFLALDEPTSDLDQERRQVLMDLISRLSGYGDQGIVGQLLIVTHHEDVMDRVETVCRVEKRDGESRVMCGGDSY